MELRYLDVARSLLQGRGLKAGAQYAQRLPEESLRPCILPALLLRNHSRADHGHWLAERCVYMASAVFPGLCAGACDAAEPAPHGVSGGGHGGAALTMSAAATFMSETVFLPLSLWQVYFLPAGCTPGCAAGPGGLVCGGGAFCYLLYLNKEVALYYLIAWVLVRGWVWWHDKAGWRASLPAMRRCWAAFWPALCWPRSRCSGGWTYNQTVWLADREQWALPALCTRL